MSAHAPSLVPGVCVCGGYWPNHGDPVASLRGVHPPTTFDENSQAAADSMERPAQRVRRMVYDVIAQYGPIATWQIEQRLEMPHQTVSARVWELHGDKLIAHAGKNIAPSGRATWRFVVAPKQ